MYVWSTYFVPGTVLETGGISVNKRDRNPCCHGEQDNDQNHTFVLCEMSDYTEW